MAYGIGELFEAVLKMPVKMFSLQAFLFFGYEGLLIPD